MCRSILLKFGTVSYYHGDIHYANVLLDCPCFSVRYIDQRLRAGFFEVDFWVNFEGFE